MSGQPSHFGSAAHPVGKTGLFTATVSIGSGKDHVMLLVLQRHGVSLQYY
ncbi:hypothetical protein [Streptomyces mirabilis]|uniref:Uncharacterized protein n=1 Tax=Streptomyces mirabilis TaxID=68239 RepID=A0ABU3V5Q3_9ACTN|nr:hypothetical protein [Streptomyces mirabilis]MCX5355849.1 hypothetical protein [Streptomyces mirabilis]MDU9001490.1 hypothetical protein [Streptomyces mirabilis]